MKKHILGAMLALPAAAHAESATLDPIVVSDTRSREVTSTTPNSIQVIDRAEIEASGAENLAQLLAGRGGVLINDRYGDGSDVGLDMRGFGEAAKSHVLVTVNGRRMNPSSDFGSLMLNSIDLNTVQQVEIIQGSASILYGNQAVGGMINIITKTPQDIDGEITLGLGSYDNLSSSVMVGATDKDGWGYRFNARLRHGDGYMDSTGIRLGSASLLVERDLGKGRAFVEFDTFSERSDTAGALFADELAADRRQIVDHYQNDYVSTHQNQVRLGYHNALNDRWRFEGELGFRRDDGENRLSSRSSVGNLFVTDRDIVTFNPRLIGSLGNNTLTIGTDFEYTTYQAERSNGEIRSVDQKIQALYGQWVHHLDARTDLTFGMRHGRVQNNIINQFFGASDDVRLKNSITIGSAGISYRPTDNWRVFARAEQNYRFAKVDEHTFTGGAPGLEDPTGVTYEAGTQYQSGGTRASLVLYRLDMENEIVYDEVSYANVNLDNTRRIGLQLSASTPLSSSLLAGLDVDLTEGEFTNGTYTGNRIPGVPRYQARAHIEWLASAATSFYLEALHVGDRVFGGDANNAYGLLDSYTVLNLSARHEQGNWLLSARINNLLNAEYAATGALGYDASWNTVPAYNPAPERNIWLSARYSF